MKKWMAALLLIFPVCSHAVLFNGTLPTDLSVYDIETTGTTVVISWPNGEKRYCYGMDATNVTAFKPLPVRLDGESLADYLKRALNASVTRDLTPAENTMCTVMALKYAWRLKPYRTNLTRTIYDTALFVAGTRKALVRAPVNTICGKFVKNYDKSSAAGVPGKSRWPNMQWREVTFNGQTGVGVCSR